MSTATSQNKDWLNTLETKLLSLDSAPIWGQSPDFDWSHFSSELEQLFQVTGLHISCNEISMRTDLLEGLGSPPSSVCGAVSSLPGNFYWLMTKQDLETLMAFFLKTNEVDDKDFQEGFYRFLILQVLDCVKQAPSFNTLTPHWKDQGLPTQEASLCLDIGIDLDKQRVWGRLVITEALRKGWKRHFVNSFSKTSEKLASLTDLDLHFQLSKIPFLFNELKKLSEGDFIVLKDCSYDPSTKEGELLICLQSQPFFRAKVKGNHIKILDQPVLSKEGDMQDENTEIHDLPLLHPDLDDEDEMDTHGDTETQEDNTLDDTNNSSDDTDSFENNDLSANSDPDSTGLDPADKDPADKDSPDKKKEPTPKVKSKKEKKEDKEEPSPEIFPVSKIPLNLTIEIGRIKTTAQKLMEIRPGNTLELDVPPESDVNLVVNGKKIGQGELMRIGDVLGVRVTRIGK